MARPHARPPGYAGGLVGHRRPRRAPSRARTSCSCRSGSAARPARLARRDRAARVRLHRPGDDRRRRLREGAAHRPGGARDRGARARARGAGRLDRRLHEPGRHRHPGPARRRPPRGRAVQRRDRLPAPLRRLARSRAGARRRRPGRPEPPDLGPRGASSTDATCCRRCSPSTATRSPTRSSCRARVLDELGAVPSYYLRYFYAHDAVLREQLDGVPRAQVVAEIERELLELYRDPRLVDKPALLDAARAARTTARPRSGSSRRSTRATAPSTRSTSATAARSPASPPTTWSRCPPASDSTGPSRCRRRRSRPSCSGSCSTSPPTSGWP